MSTPNYTRTVKLGWRQRLWVYRLWLEQGRRRDFPVVLMPGVLLVLSDGKCVISGWAFDCTRQTDGAVDAVKMWNELIARYPECIRKVQC